MIMRMIRASSFALLLVGTVCAFMACKSGGVTGAAASSANLFERQPRTGTLAFIVRANGQNGQSVGDVQVSFMERVTNDGGARTDLDGGSPPDCEPVAIGPCVVTSCVQGTPIGGAESRSVAPAGDITVTDTTSGKSQIFTASMGGYQYTGQAPIPANPGDAVTFNAAGGTTPAFSQSLIAPLAITPTPFPCPDASADASPTSCKISRSQALTLGWSGGDQGSVALTLAAFGAGCNNAQSCPPLQSTAVCKFDVASGSGTIPKEVLGRFPESSVSVGYAVEDTVDFAQGDYIIRVSAITATANQLSFPLTQ